MPGKTLPLLSDKKYPFIFSTQFYREPSYPVEELKKDMRVIKRLGLNTIKIQEAWAYEERREGRIDLSRMEGFLQEAKKVGLYVFFTVCLESPAWAWRKYPDALQIDMDGNRMYSFNHIGYTDGKPGPCWHHPGMRQAATRFMKHFARNLGKHKNIVMWQVAQEPHFFHCHCPLCFEHFRDWARKHYPTIEALNDTWRTAFGCWEDILPPQETRRYNGRGSIYSDWWRFHRDKTKGFLRWRAETLKANDPYHRPAAANLWSSMPGSEFEWDISEAVDIFGVSFYPSYHHLAQLPGNNHDGCTREQHLPRDMWNTCLHFDYIRVATKDMPWGSEFQGGNAGHGLHHGGAPEPEDMRRWLLLALSSGLKGIFFWSHRPDISGGEGHQYGIFGRKLELTPKAQEIGRIIKGVEKHKDLFKQGILLDRHVAILVNEDTYRHMNMNYVKSGHVLERAVRGWYRTLWEMGIVADFVGTKDAAKGMLKEYKIVVMPFALAVSDALAKAVCEYVKAGGVLISDACPGRYSDWDLANPSGFAPGFEELFGAEEKWVKMCAEQDGSKYNLPASGKYWFRSYLGKTHLKGVGAFAGVKLPASFYVEGFEPKAETAKTILLCGKETCGVENRYGKGRAYLIGTFPGLAAMHSADNAGLKKSIGRILDFVQVKPNRTGNLIWRRITDGAKEARFLINPTGNKILAHVNTGKYKQAEDLLDEPIRKRGNTIEITIEPFETRCVVIL